MLDRTLSCSVIQSSQVLRCFGTSKHAVGILSVNWTPPRRKFTTDDGEFGCKYFVIRAESGAIAAVSGWSENADPFPSKDTEERRRWIEEGVKRCRPMYPTERTNFDLDAAYNRAIAAVENTDVTGDQKYNVLQLLATDPDHQRKGLGKALLEHGLKRADQQGMPCYMLASTLGKPLYEKHGFVVKAEVPFDGTQHGGRSQGRHWAMFRPACEVADE